VILWSVAVARADVAEGHAAWAAGDVEGAIAAWRAEPASGVLAYDLGTALLAAGRPLEALPPLLLASRERPRDASVLHNLSIARSRLAQGEGAAPPPPIERTPAITRVATPGELAGLALVAALVATALTAARARVGGGVVAAALFASLASMGVAGSAWWSHRAHPIAVVGAEAPLRDSPDALAHAERSLPAGSEVRVVRAWGPFTLVEDGRGRQGWVAEDALVRAW
jgi:hypothetical protein